MHLTQGTFSYLPPFTDAEITAQIQYAIDQDWPVSIEYTDDPHPRNVYWEMWGLPMFDVKDAAAVFEQVKRCRDEHAECYIRVNAYDRKKGRQTTALSFIVNRPLVEPGFRVERTEFEDRQIKYTLHAYATERPSGQRYRDS